MKGKKSKSQNWKISTSCKMPEKRCIKASTIQHTPECGRDAEVNDNCAFILQLIILKSYLTCHRLSIHKRTAFAPVTVSIIPCSIPFHQLRFFSVQKCMPNHWWRFSVFKNVHRFTGQSFTIPSCILFHLSWFLNHFSTHGFQNSFTSHGLQNPPLYTALSVSYQHPQLHTFSAVSCKPFERS